MRTIEQMVKQEVSCCLSSLIATLAGGDAHPGTDLAELCDRALGLAEPVPDYEKAAIQAGWKLENGLWTNDQGDDFPNPQFETAEEVCDREELEPVDSEVYEHWAVSGWLAEKLLAHGEKVDTDFAGLNVWARQGKGCISADGIIARIYAATVPAESEETRRGQLLVDVLCLHPAKDERDRYHTQWGSKTPLGIFHTVARIIEKGE